MHSNIDLISLLTLIQSIILTSLALNSQGSIPTEIGLLSDLTYLRLSYNAFTGTAPEGLGNLTKLQLLQLQSNRITQMPNISRLDESIFNKSTFITDCGVPSAFTDPMKCDNCTMCCKYLLMRLLNSSHLLSANPYQFSSTLTSCTR